MQAHTVDTLFIGKPLEAEYALVDAGVDAWWPDEGDWFNFHERMLLLDPAEDERTLVSVPVDPAGKLPDGRAFKGIEDFKSLLLEDKDAFLKCLTEKMLVYALGRPLVFGDRTLVRNIVGDLKRQPTMDTLIKAIVTSDAFQNKGQGEEE